MLVAESLCPGTLLTIHPILEPDQEIHPWAYIEATINTSFPESCWSRKVTAVEQVASTFPKDGETLLEQCQGVFLVH